MQEVNKILDQDDIVIFKQSMVKLKNGDIKEVDPFTKDVLKAFFKNDIDV